MKSNGLPREELLHLLGVADCWAVCTGHVADCWAVCTGQNLGKMPLCGRRVEVRDKAEENRILWCTADWIGISAAGKHSRLSGRVPGGLLHSTSSGAVRHPKIGPARRCTQINAGKTL